MSRPLPSANGDRAIPSRRASSASSSDTVSSTSVSQRPAAHSSASDAPRRTHDPGDRRVWLVELTAAGRDLVPQISAVDAAMRAAFRDGLGRDERHVLG